METKITKSHLSIEIKGDLEKKLIGIKNQWVHIWLNFIDNTINAALKNHIEAPYFHILFEENCIVICDNAGGMAADIHNENEMGLGIYMCVELVKKHGGDITYQNVDDGLKVMITFSTQTIP